MKIQSLAVIFIIIILPISLILSSYIGSQVQTLSLQVSYDAKLYNATYDALKAFQLNTVNSDTSDLSNSKIRDIEASAATFFNSIASNFNMAGYNQKILTEYVPALVYTMYDGYYIYSDYENHLDSSNTYYDPNVGLDGKYKDIEKSDKELLNNDKSYNSNATYSEDEKISGLKPYVYYSCRYQPNPNSDFVITYSMDNYITIQGIINDQWTYEYGYLLDNITEENGTIKYRNIPIDDEGLLSEYVYNPKIGEVKKYNYIKVNGVKYYQGEGNSRSRGMVFYYEWTIL